MNHCLTIRALICVFLLTLFSIGCGRRGIAVNSGQVRTNNDGNGSGAGGTPYQPGNTSPECGVVPSTTEVVAFIDGQGQLNASPVQFVTAMKIGGVPVDFNFLQFQYDPNSLVSQGAATKNANLSQQIILRPIRQGTFQVSAVVQDPASGQQASCNTSIRVTVSTPPGLDVLISAYGAQHQTLAELSNGLGAIIHFESINASVCQLFRDGVALPATAQLSGEFSTGALVNSGAAQIHVTYSITCSGNGQSKSAQVVLTVNPNPVSTFVIAGAGASLKVRAGANATLNWTSSFANSGCTLGDGVTNGGVTPNGSLQVNGIQSSKTYVFVCGDQAGHAITKSVAITVLNPSVTLTANGATGSYSKTGSQDVLFAITSRDVQSCVVNPGNHTGTNFNFTLTSAQIPATTLFTATCQSEVGPVTATVNIVVSNLNTQLACSSHHYRYAECFLPTGANISAASVSVKYSHSACTAGYSFGFAGNKLWVHHGCRALFNLTYTP